MPRPLSRILTTILIACSATLLAIASHAQIAAKPEPSRSGITYLVKPDLRKCAFPMCGGWFLTPINQYSLQLENEGEAYQSLSLLPNSIYVANINYKALGLKPAQIEVLEADMRNEQALLRGNITSNSQAKTIAPSPTKTLVVKGAWIGANKTVALGPYLKVASSGIVCITTPCPYYRASLVNSLYSTNFHELTLTKAELTREQEAQAWQAVASEGLIMTGLTYESKGQTGPGTGISATKVFFPFPTKF